MFRKLDLFPSQGEQRTMSILLWPLERANLDQWPNMSPHLNTETHPVSETLRFIGIQNYGWWTKSINPVILEHIWLFIVHQLISYIVNCSHQNKKKVKLCTSSCILMGDWRYSSTILDLGNRWRWRGQIYALATLLLGIHCTRGWVGPRACMDTVEQKCCCP
jgi:hypothetical protein